MTKFSGWLRHWYSTCVGDLIRGHILSPNNPWGPWDRRSTSPNIFPPAPAFPPKSGLEQSRAHWGLSGLILHLEYLNIRALFLRL